MLIGCVNARINADNDIGIETNLGMKRIPPRLTLFAICTGHNSGRGMDKLMLHSQLTANSSFVTIKLDSFL